MRLNRHLNAILFLWGASFSARTAEAPPDLAALSRAAARETNHLETSAASWISIHQIDNGPKVFVHVLQSGHKHRWTLSAEYNGKLSEMLRITQRGDLWYLEEGGNRTINRPFEATLRFPGAYLDLLRSGLRFITDPSQLKDGKLESVECHVATYRLPLPASSVSQMRNLLSPPTDFSDLRSDPRFVKGKALIEETLAHSQEIGVALFDLEADVSETNNVADQHPEVVGRLQVLAEKCREDLGDSATGREGKNVRRPGALPEK